MPTDTRAAVLFDLDGTLTDPFEGITNSIRHALEKMGRAAPAAQDLAAHIGPPLQVTFADLLQTADEALIWEAVGHYRERYARIGKFENRLIPGVRDVLLACVEAGYFVSLATSKVESYSRDIVDHFGLSDFLNAVHGSAPDGTNSDKTDLIRHILAVERLSATRTVMVGDRFHDVAGAKANGVATIGVLWGFGERAELEAVGAAAVVENPAQLSETIAALLAAGVA